MTITHPVSHETSYALDLRLPHELSATRGERIHHGVDDRHPLVAVTLRIELSVPTIPPQDVVNVEAVRLGLR